MNTRTNKYAGPTRVTTEFNIKHNQSSCFGYGYDKGIYLKHKTYELIVLCMGSSWDSKFFKGMIVFCGGDNSFRKEESGIDPVAADAYIESCYFYCEAGDVFDTFPTEDFTLFEGEINIRQYDK